MPAFTYLWTNRCRLNMIEDGSGGEPTDFMAGNSFTSRGVKPGDLVYVVAVHAGRVYLIGRVRVKKVWARGDWDARHDTPTLWEGDEVLEGEDGTPMHFERAIPARVLRQLRFIDRRSRQTGLGLEGGKVAEPQSLRSVRRLAMESAEVLDGML